MICLKNRTFAVSQTTRNEFIRICKRLWFAWKIVLLQYRKQRISINTRYQLSCDLLEKSYFCSIANNQNLDNGLPFAVVICLKNRTFAVSQTTTFVFTTFSNWLWFAWKIVLLQYRKQQSRNLAINWCSCDLLEKSYFCSIANNYQFYVRLGDVVVICLKNRTFAVSQTTTRFPKRRRMALWFAWKIVLLQYRKQRQDYNPAKAISCDLLEKSYFCSIANNLPSYRHNRIGVVICLKNRTFAVSQTTWTL